MRMLSATTTRDNSSRPTATPSSMPRAESTRARCGGSPPRLPRALVSMPGRASGGEEARFLHQSAVLIVRGQEPVGVAWAAHGRVLEGARLDELLPLRQRPHALEQVGVECHLLRA